MVIMKTIQVTEENKAKNPKYLSDTAVGEWKRFSKMPSSWNAVSPFNPDVEGFIDYVAPIVEVVPKTAQELYDALIAQSKIVFDEFSIELLKAAAPYSILGNHPQGLIDVTVELMTVKAEIKSGLQYYLDNDMIDKLTSFNFYDERGLRLQATIESFK